ncbi:MAG: hypothetical protein AAGA91_14355 [Pseudomonadota bacterium]
MSDDKTPTDLSGAVEYPHPFDELVVELVRSATRYVDILSPALDHNVFDKGEMVAALSDLARRSRQTRVRILISDARAVVGRGHRLLQLARRLPSTIIIQRLSDHPDWRGETVVTRDRDGVAYRPAGSDSNGFYEPNSRASALPHLDQFEELWRYSERDPNLRALQL